MKPAFVTLSDVPFWGKSLQNKAEAEARRSRGGAALMDFGKLKQKPPDLNWWVRGVHQIVVWVGTSRKGWGRGSRGSNYG